MRQALRPWAEAQRSTAARLSGVLLSAGLQLVSAASAVLVARAVLVESVALVPVERRVVVQQRREVVSPASAPFSVAEEVGQ
jgi:hypothetical protein